MAALVGSPTVPSYPSSGTTFTAERTPAAVGNLLVLVVGCGNGTTATVSSVIDSQGNTWTREFHYLGAPAGHGYDNTLEVWTTLASAVTADTITFDLSTSDHPGALVYEASGASGIQVGTLATSYNGPVTASLTPSSSGPLLLFWNEDWGFTAAPTLATVSGPTWTLDANSPSYALIGASAPGASGEVAEVTCTPQPGTSGQNEVLIVGIIPIATVPTYTGTGSIAGAFSLAGTAAVTEVYAGTGTIAGTFALSGTGTVGGVYTGTGTISAAFTLSGTGTVTVPALQTAQVMTEMAPQATGAQSAVPSNIIRVVTVVAVLNADGSTAGWLTQIVVGGTVTIDTTSEVVRTCSFQCLDPTGILAPLDPSGGMLSPDGQEIKVYCGYVDGENNVSLFPQGVFGITECDVASGNGSSVAPGPVLSVTGSDRSLRVSAATFDDAFAIAAGATIGEGVLAILAQQAPWVTATNIAPSDTTIAAQAFQPGDDPMAGIQDLCAAGGQLAFFDAEGVFCVVNDPSANPSKPQATFVDGNGNLAIDVTRSVTNSPGYNGIIVIGQALGNSSAVISGAAYDMNPTSPTYVLGPYGKRPAPPVQVSTVSTNEAAAAMAQALLPQVLGLTRQTVVDCIPCFWLEAYDLVRVVNAATQTNEVEILEQATVPMDYTQTEAITSVPLGTPVSDFDGLNNQPSVAAYAPVSSGAFNYNSSTGSYTYTPSSTSTSSGPTTGGFGHLVGNSFGAGFLVFGGFRILRSLRSGMGMLSLQRGDNGVTTIERTVEEDT